jgi:hypothetical protein
MVSPADANEVEEQVVSQEACGDVQQNKGIEQEDVQSGARTCRKMPDPFEPSPQEMADHQLTHLPFRNWCRHCCRGRGIEMPHRKRPEAERVLPEVHFDFCFLGNEGKKDEVGETLPVLVVREVGSRMTMSAAVPSKSTGTFIARRVVAFLKEIGCAQCDIIVKSD